jgi:hypothetical protein
MTSYHFPDAAMAELNGRNDQILLRKPIIVFTILVAVLAVVPAAVGSAVYVLLALYAMRGQRETIEAFTVMFLVLLGNPVMDAEGGDMFRWLVLLAGFARLVWDSVIGGLVVRMPNAVTAVLGAFFCWGGVGAFLSNVPMLSLLKLVSFGVGITTILLCFFATMHLADYWRSWFYTFFIFALFASIVLLPLGLGYIRTNQGFQGIFSHPQIMGPVAATATAWFSGIFLSENRPVRWHLVLGMLIGGVIVFMSGARTGLFALGVGLILVFTMLWSSKIRTVSLDILAQPKLWVTALIVCAGLGFYASEVTTMATNFIYKDDISEGGSTEVFQASRGDLMAKSMKNFRARPVAGIGFGVPSSFGNYGRRVESVMGIPVGASSEKGFMPSAMLEEVGIVGTGLMIIFLWFVSASVVQWGGLAITWMYWACLLINVGAAVFFSIGGLGFFVWLIVGFCYTQARWQEIQLQMEGELSVSKHEKQKRLRHARVN